MPNFYQLCNPVHSLYQFCSHVAKEVQQLHMNLSNFVPALCANLASVVDVRLLSNALNVYKYPTAFGKPATVPSPGCVCSHALGMCVCVYVCVCVCVCVPSCAGSMHRCIVSSMHSSIHRFERCLDSFFDSSMYQTRPMW